MPLRARGAAELHARGTLTPRSFAAALVDKGTVVENLLHMGRERVLDEGRGRWSSRNIVQSQCAWPTAH